MRRGQRHGFPLAALRHQVDVAARQLPAAQAAVDAGAAEVILLRDGCLTEASASNVFVVKDGVLLAPPKTHLILPGITYDVVLELAQANGIPLEVRAVDRSRGARRRRNLADLVDQGSAGDHHARRHAGGRAASPAPLFRRMYALYQEFKQTVMRRAA